MVASSRVVNREVYPEGAVIFREGEPGSGAYIVQSGHVEIARAAPGGSHTVIGRIGPGGIFGEMAVIDEQPRIGTARATEMTVVIHVTRHMFEAKLAETDPFIRRLVQILADMARRNLAEKRPEWSVG